MRHRRRKLFFRRKWESGALTYYMVISLAAFVYLAGKLSFARDRLQQTIHPRRVQRTTWKIPSIDYKLSHVVIANYTFWQSTCILFSPIHIIKRQVCMRKYRVCKQICASQHQFVNRSACLKQSKHFELKVKTTIKYENKNLYIFIFLHAIILNWW